MRKRMIAGWGLAAMALSGCMPAEMPGQRDGRALFLSYCAECHGATAEGNGPLARALETAPKNLTLISVRHGNRFPRAEILSTIDGYARSDAAGPGMPEFGELLEGDLVPLDTGDGRMTPTPRKLVALLEYLESIQAGR